jgi:hypothetical protein
MGQVIPIRRGIPAGQGPIDPIQVIGTAFHKAVGLADFMPNATDRPDVARAILLQRIVDSAQRGMRNVDQLCADALEHLRNSEVTFRGESAPTRNNG